MGNNPVSGVDPNGGFVDMNHRNYDPYKYEAGWKNYYTKQNEKNFFDKYYKTTEQKRNELDFWFENELKSLKHLEKNGNLTPEQLKAEITKLYTLNGELLFALQNENWAFDNPPSVNTLAAPMDDSNDGHVSLMDMARAEEIGRATNAIASAMMNSRYGKSILMIDGNTYNAAKGTWGHYVDLEITDDGGHWYNRETGEISEAKWDDGAVAQWTAADYSRFIINADLNYNKGTKAGLFDSREWLGPSLIALGSNILETRGKFKGATLGTSIASESLSTAFPQTFTNKLGKNLGGKVAKNVGTNVIGRAAGRFVPIVGWGLTTYDVGEALWNINTMNMESFDKMGFDTDLYMAGGL